MSSTTEKTAAAENPSLDDSDTDPSGRSFPGRVRGQRLEITNADLKMYSAITGRKPSSTERERALTWSEGDPLKDRIAGVVGSHSPASSSTALATSQTRGAWSPSGLSLRIRDMWFNGVTIRMHRPHFSDWFRKLSSAIHQGRQRVKKAG